MKWLFKAHVKQHTRVLESGNVATVREHEDKRTKKQKQTSSYNPTETEAFKEWFSNSKVVGPDGKPKIMYHGSMRADRIGDKFDSKRATSGPMAYFTDNPDIASHYAMDKKDTSAEIPDDYSGWFKYTPPGAKRGIPISQAWNYLDWPTQLKIKKLLPTIGYKNPDEGDGDIVPDSESPMPADGIEWELQQARGNGLKALVEIWLNSGQLYGDERRFMDVLRAAGIRDVVYDDPYEERGGVFPVYLCIRNPLNTANIPDEVVSELHQVGRSKRAKSAAGGNPDLWDKNTISGKDWLAAFDKDRADGTNLSWTRVPDWVTDTLKRLGYDGIRDTGGKLGGDKHDVWVPFRENQVKSAIGNSGKFDNSNPKFTKALIVLKAETTRRAHAAVSQSGKVYQVRQHLMRTMPLALGAYVTDDTRVHQDHNPFTMEPVGPKTEIHTQINGDTVLTFRGVNGEVLGTMQAYVDDKGKNIPIRATGDASLLHERAKKIWGKTYGAGGQWYIEALVKSGREIRSQTDQNGLIREVMEEAHKQKKLENDIRDVNDIQEAIRQNVEKQHDGTARIIIGGRIYVVPPVPLLPNGRVDRAANRVRYEEFLKKYPIPGKHGQRIELNMVFMGCTDRDDYWEAAQLEGVTENGPIWEKLPNEQPAPTLYESGRRMGSEQNCELCDHPVRKEFIKLVNRKRGYAMMVGSECGSTAHVGAASIHTSNEELEKLLNKIQRSGTQHVKKEKYRLMRDQLSEKIEELNVAKERFRARFSRLHPQTQRRQWRIDRAGGMAENFDNKMRYRTADLAPKVEEMSDIQIKNWLDKHGKELDDAIKAYRDYN